MKQVKETHGFLGYTGSEYAVFRKYAWRAVIGFSLVYCFLYSGRLNLSSAIPMMVKETNWTTGQLGILSSVFFWTYGLGQLANGRLSEIFGVNRFIISAVLLSAAANILIGFQSSLIIIAILWAFNGYFQSMAWAPGMALLSRWWPNNRRGFATGMANGFSDFGQAVAMIMVIVAMKVSPQLGWRSAFFLPVMVAAAVAIVYWAMTKDAPEKVGLKPFKEVASSGSEQTTIQAASAGKSKLYPYVYLLESWKYDVWLLIIALQSIVRYGLLTWIPLYFTKTMGLDVSSGLIQSLVLPIGMGFGALFVPMLADKYLATNRLPGVIICALIGGVVALVFPFMHNELIISVLLFIAGFFVYAINGLTWAPAMDAGGREFAGTASGLMDFAAYVGASVQSIVFGFTIGNNNWMMLFILITIANVLMIVLAGIAGRKHSVTAQS
ncbi:MFS transporter [Secundilactobacillus collinoides]|uniref:Major facilitator superfamily (MFS) profile domain-containing protein n=1 Tax=Secundilactobacillus collinoides DSM 20515 = JCM 1123 TaxID=1423733 RepID=A0A0R2BNN7_SECCO|nr:MFS transporter [Secundilactobacillus collinoides]KRM77723.1 hypothetical protein FC82_GL003096 [Secundilactobacillus collinoides DSM 20515 = JCM 1123]